MKAWSLSFPSTTPCIAPKLPFFHSLPLTSPKRRRPSSLSVLSTSDDKDTVLLSTTEHSDGSSLFRFGDASELVKMQEDEVKSQKKDETELLDVKLKGSNKDLVEKINYKVKTPKSVAKLDNSVQLEKKTSTSNVEQVVELKQKGEENSIGNNVTVIEQDGEEKKFVNNVVSSQVVEQDEEETTTSNVEKDVKLKEEEEEAEENVISDNVLVKEQDEKEDNFVDDVASSQVVESRVLIGDPYKENNVGETASNLDSSASSCSEIEVMSSFVTEDSSSDESEGVDDLLNSVVGEGNNMHKEDDVVVVDDGGGVDKNVVGRVVPELSAMNAEVAMDKDVPTNNVDVPVSIEEMESKKVADENLPSPEFREAIDEGCTQNGDAGTSLLHPIQPETTGEAIDEGGTQNGDAGRSLLNAIEPETTGEEVCIEELFLSSGATFLANPSKALTGREDAYFLYENWFGIADGVRHWSFEGTINESYAHELIENCKNIVTDKESTLMAEPLEVLSKAAEETQSNGSSTALIAYFDGQALSAANIGDSGFIIVRNGSIFKRSSPMMHEFNFPRHIERGDDLSKLVQIYKTDLEEGDIIITASDGLFDNVYDQEIVSIASKSLQSGSEPQEMSELLATRALEVGQTASARSPFGDAAQAAGYTGYSGGKLDDVTVIVSLVKNRSSASSLSL